MIINGKTVQTMFFGGEKWIKGKWVGKEAKLIDGDGFFMATPIISPGVNYDTINRIYLSDVIEYNYTYKILGYLPNPKEPLESQFPYNENCYLIYKKLEQNKPDDSMYLFAIVSENLLQPIGGVIRHTISLLTALKNHLTRKVVLACM